MPRVVVIGGVAREVFTESEAEPRLAGSALYAATAARHAGADVTMIASVGTDDIPTVNAICVAHGVAPVWLPVSGPSPTFVVDQAWWRPLRPMYKPAGMPPLPPSIDVAPADVVLIFGHPEWEPETTDFVAALCEKATLVWDRQGWLSRSVPWANAARIPARRRVLSLNLGELATNEGLAPGDVLAWHLPPGVHAGVVKDGPWGVHLLDATASWRSIGGHRVEPVTTIGSGDIFAGALSASLARGQDLLDAAQEATRLAAAAISDTRPFQYGADAGRPAPASSPSDRAALRLIVSTHAVWVDDVTGPISAATGLACSGATSPDPSAVALALHGPSGSATAHFAPPGRMDDLVRIASQAALHLVDELNSRV